MPPRVRSQAYHLDAKLDFKRRTLDVVEILEWTNTTAEQATEINLSVLPAHGGFFTLAGVISQDGVPAHAAIVEHDTNLRVTFARPVAPQQTTSIVIPFRLEVPRVSDPPPGWDSSNAYLTAARGVIQFGHWFPIWSTVHGFHPVGDPQVTFNADEITLDLETTTELGVDAVAATGVLQPGATTSQWRFEAHDVRDLAFIVSPKYSVTAQHVECDGRDTRLLVYALDADAEIALRHGEEALRAFNEWFGCYPYSVLSIAQAPGRKFSLEFPMMSLMSGDAMANPALVRHEVAHQWWYGIVGNDQMLEPWLDEAFAQYSARLLDDVPIEYCNSRGGVISSVFEFEQWMDCSYYSSVYLKGAAFLDDVHRRMGTDAFFDALRDIVATYRHGVATTSGVLGILEKHSARGLRGLFTAYGFAQDPPLPP